jgi:hypothetical protein
MNMPWIGNWFAKATLTLSLPDLILPGGRGTSDQAKAMQTSQSRSLASILAQGFTEEFHASYSLDQKFEG